MAKALLATDVRVHSDRRPLLVLAIATALTVIFSIAFLTLSIEDGQLRFTWSVVDADLSRQLIGMRIGRLGPMLVVGFAVGLATVVFQTISNNRILTPNIMGIDALFQLIQTALVFFIGGSQLLNIPKPYLFFVEAILLLGVSAVLFYLVFIKSRRSLYTLALVGIITGIFFRSVTSLFQRLIDPQEFLISQDRSLARFDIVDPALFATTLAVCVVAAGIIWVNRYRLDLLTLGKDPAISLGLSYRATVMTLLVCCAVLVSVTTALVGPLTFLGLLVANLALVAGGTHKHRWLLPITGMTGAATLVMTQFILERVMGVGTVVTVVIELIGGLLFLAMILKGISR